MKMSQMNEMKWNEDESNEWSEVKMSQMDQMKWCDMTVNQMKWHLLNTGTGTNRGQTNNKQQTTTITEQACWSVNFFFYFLIFLFTFYSFLIFCFYFFLVFYLFVLFLSFCLFLHSTYLISKKSIDQQTKPQKLNKTCFLSEREWLF